MKAIRLKANATCEVCRLGFYASPGHKAKGGGRFCSIACRTKVWRKDGHPSWEGGGLDRTCATCGVTFKVKPSHAAKGDGVFCSVECKFSGRRKQKRVCKACGKEFEAYQAHIKRGGGLYCSRACVPGAPTKNGGGSRGKGGRRGDLGGLYVRSRWEANYARYLNWLQRRGEIAKWEYEPQTFVFEKIKRGSRSYTPDFRVTGKDGCIEYHEIKGYMDARSATKIKRFAKYFPKEQLVVIDAAAYRAISLAVSRLLIMWESA